MKEGKKVRRISWEVLDWYIFIKDNKILDSCGLRRYYNIDSIEAEDWELYEEEDNWSLDSLPRDEIMNISETYGKNKYRNTTYYPDRIMKTLKEKIQEDLKSLSCRYDDIDKMKYISEEGVKEILDNRFGY